MTNRELLAAPRDSLSPAERQKQYVLRAESSPMPCPACRKSADAMTASGTDIDRYRFGVATTSYRCPHCSAELEIVVPFVATGPGWHWELRHDWLADRLLKASLYERITDKGKEGNGDRS
jgi:hypothetical protein